MLKSRDELESYYKSLDANYEGYIQMSDRQISHIFKTKQTLPSWESIHNELNFIFEMALYDGAKSILIRQQNDSWIVIEKDLDWDSLENEDKNVFYSIQKTKEIRVAQIWEEKEDKLCSNLEVLQPAYQLFAGFEGVSR